MYYDKHVLITQLTSRLGTIRNALLEQYEHIYQMTLLWKQAAKNNDLGTEVTWVIANVEMLHVGAGTCYYWCEVN